jgi:hypothetical protein
LVQTLNTLSGVAGPLPDLFFVKTDLTRQTVVATKATAQVMAHAVKIAFWGFPLLAMLWDPGLQADAHLPPLWGFAAVAPLSLLGNWLGGLVLDRMTDADFRTWTRWIVTATGAVYLARGLWLGRALLHRTKHVVFHRLATSLATGLGEGRHDRVEPARTAVDLRERRVARRKFSRPGRPFG